MVIRRETFIFIRPSTVYATKVSPSSLSDMPLLLTQCQDLSLVFVKMVIFLSFHLLDFELLRKACIIEESIVLKERKACIMKVHS